MVNHFKQLFELGLLSFDREKAFFDLLRNSIPAMMAKEGDKTRIQVKKGGKKALISITNEGVTVSGDYDYFSYGFEKVYKNVLSEYALSVRSKKELLSVLNVGEFYKFVLVPVLLEVRNSFKLNINWLVSEVKKLGAEKKFLFFKVKNNVSASWKNNVLELSFDDAKFIIKFKKYKVDNSLLSDDVNVGKFQVDVHDAFFAGLPYTILALNGSEFNYSFEGSDMYLRELAKNMLESLYDLLIIENV
ncbi:Uncharacterised protein [Candidatus Tiddalikarchaeum anstoanum]|nr:Uncharacterised protein [Candidatus Tiddalikarchaeum anstoanum]